jgi:hypothetical protein
MKVIRHQDKPPDDPSIRPLPCLLHGRQDVALGKQGAPSIRAHRQKDDRRPVCLLPQWQMNRASALRNRLGHGTASQIISPFAKEFRHEAGCDGAQPSERRRS